MDIGGAVQCILAGFLDRLNGWPSWRTRSWCDPEVEATEHMDTRRNVP